MKKSILFTLIILIILILVCFKFVYLSPPSAFEYRTRFPQDRTYSIVQQCDNPDTVFVLSMDGGGMRGIIQAHVLNYIENRARKPISKLFDVVGGTSVGAIAATVLTARDAEGFPAYSAKDLLAFFDEEGPKIFSRSPWQIIKTLGGYNGPVFDGVNKKTIMHKLLGNRTITDALTNIILTGYRINDNESIAFTSWDAAHTADKNFRVADVLDAVTSPPAYFPPSTVKSISGKKEFIVIDGIIGLVSPALLSLLKTIDHYPDAHHFIVLSIGVGKFQILSSQSKLEQWGKLQWIPYLLPMFSEAQSQEASFNLRTIQKLMEDRKKSNGGSYDIKYFRIDLDIPEEIAINQLNPEKNYVRLFHEYGLKAIVQNKTQLDEIIRLLKMDSKCL